MRISQWTLTLAITHTQSSICSEFLFEIIEFMSSSGFYLLFPKKTHQHRVFVTKKIISPGVIPLPTARNRSNSPNHHDQCISHLSPISRTPPASLDMDIAPLALQARHFWVGQILNKHYTGQIHLVASKTDLGLWAFCLWKVARWH